MPTHDPASNYAILPAITEIDRYLHSQGLPAGKKVRKLIQAWLCSVALEHDSFQDPTQSPFHSKQDVLHYLAQNLTQLGHTSLRTVINATGIVVHTNLGRSAIAESHLQQAHSLLTRYTNLEMDPLTGKRGERGKSVLDQLSQLAGSEAALIVNNNAAAVALMLMALPNGSEVIISRGELVEIGGSFRIPDIVKACGVKLIEVGTTNRTSLQDYAQAITPNTAALLKVHPSNYVIKGFVAEVQIEALARLAKQATLACFFDMGSGSFYRFTQNELKAVPVVQDFSDKGIDLLCFSADKLLGGIQAGLIVGKKSWIAALAKHPFYRTFRIDKARLFILENCLTDYFEISTLRKNNATVRFLERTEGELQKMTDSVWNNLKPKTGWICEKVSTLSKAGGGAIPELELPSVALSFQHTTISSDQMMEFLRRQQPALIARIQDQALLIDFRAVFEDELAVLTDHLNLLMEQSE